MPLEISIKCDGLQCNKKLKLSGNLNANMESLFNESEWHALWHKDSEGWLCFCPECSERLGVEGKL